MVRRGGGELADAPRAEDAHHGAEGEVLFRRHDAGEGAEEQAGLLLVGGDGGEEVALAGGKAARPRVKSYMPRMAWSRRR
jgi:hypothetical protein